MSDLLPTASIQQRILFIRGKRVLLDSDLARFYGTTTRELNRAASRHPDRFPEDFAFYLTAEETANLMFQLGTSSSAHGGRRKPARVFTEQGVAMLSSVLRTDRAAAVSVALIRVFVRLREMLTENRQLAAKLAALERQLSTHDGAIRELFAAIRQLLSPTPRPKREIDFQAQLRPPSPASDTYALRHFVRSRKLPRARPFGGAKPTGNSELLSASRLYVPRRTRQRRNPGPWHRRKGREKETRGLHRGISAQARRGSSDIFQKRSCSPIRRTLGSLCSRRRKSHNIIIPLPAESCSLRELILPLAALRGLLAQQSPSASHRQTWSRGLV
ncbi:MAG: ORF6N domain-containing protein [Candidatus Didemnitutus sp.]|nr:ORF6N domain-containing protein [Candidatus Didemnitutus sp.]